MNSATAKEVRAEGDWTVKGRDLRQAYAGFCRVPLGDAAIWSLSQASSQLPTQHIGFQVWITEIAGADTHMAAIVRWAKRLAWCASCLKPRMGVRRRRMVEGYRADWGDQAALDAVQLALTGSCPSARTQSEHFQIHRDGYKRLRNFVAGALVLQSSQFESELAIAVRNNRE